MTASADHLMLLGVLFEASDAKNSTGQVRIIRVEVSSSSRVRETWTDSIARRAADSANRFELFVFELLLK